MYGGVHSFKSVMLVSAKLFKYDYSCVKSFTIFTGNMLFCLFFLDMSEPKNGCCGMLA